MQNTEDTMKGVRLLEKLTNLYKRICTTKKVEDANSFITLSELYTDSLELTNHINIKIGETLVRVLKDIIPDIEYQQGDIDSDWTVIYLRSETYEKRLSEDTDEYSEPLDLIISTTFPQLQHYISSYIWLTQEEAVCIRARLIQWKEGRKC